MNPSRVVKKIWYQEISHLRVVAEMREHGVHLGVCGDTTVRFRPSLTFDSTHLGILLDRLSTVLANNNK